MANNSTSFYVNLAGNVSSQASKFGNALSTMANKGVSNMNKLSNSVKKVGSGLASLSQKINNVGNIALPVLGVGVGAGAAAVSKSMIRVAADFEMANIRMKQTFGKRGDEAMAWLKKFATDTPMAFGDVQDAAMQMMTAGIDPMNGSLQALVDWNAKVGGSTENLNAYISSFAKMKIKGKMSWEDIQPLLERNVPVLKMLAEATGNKYTEKQIMKMIQDGKMQGAALDALWKQMGKNAKGAAKEQMKTWDGLVSNLEDTWVSMQAQFMEHGAFDSLKKELGSFLEWLNSKIDDGTLDEFAKTVSETLTDALKQLKETANDVKPILEKVGSVMGWVSEQAGGYGNIAKFVGGFYLANKVANWGITQKTVKGGWGLAKWGVGKFRKNKGGVANDVAGALGETVGVTPVYVTNFPASFGGGYGGVEQDKRKNKRQNNKTGNGKNRVASVTTAVASNAEKAVANKGVTQAVGNTVKYASQSLSATTKAATSAISRTATRAVPYLNVAASAVEGAVVLMDEQSSTQDKSEAIGSIAGATAGAIVGQALIPIPVVGAAVGSYVGSWLGEWLGSEVGEYLSDPEPIKNELNGTIQVAVKASEHLIATATASKVQTNQKQDNMNIAVQMGTLGPGMGMW
ncbi:tape measure protein [Pasteurella multocida]|uniref:tape measure protein n=1 Tax=Pasteurella multocida TaxID=747 RepID=UPI00147CC87F|nr:tape measure protein [Pasteurella multocida]MCW4599976.1 tape measure protein [Pasteurella multocida subsp. multocida]NNI37898.1 tape measure domain-containing protein [Pasteurella multocida]NNI43404.1 tape measure domain-containing protein [Pasteurella multocida]NNI50738.1 tape measure domain-containing protein [Pasteurella multocida]NNI67164.1 tape measure domain-containing protein [Pasteurella multocida]